MPKTVKSLLMLLICCVLLPVTVAYADDAIVINVVPTPTPEPPLLAPQTPEPTPTPAVMSLPYDAREGRRLSAGFWSCLPPDTPPEIKLAWGEVVQNRVDDILCTGLFRGTISACLQQGDEYPAYRPDAYRSRENDGLADYLMRTWAEAHLGDRTHRIVPATGVYCDVSADGRHISVWDDKWESVYEQ